MASKPPGATRSAKHGDVPERWILVDAKDVVLGRLASRVAIRLRGKHHAPFTPHADTGDFVIIVNAEKVKLTGNKREGKIYYKHTGWTGSTRSTTAGKILEGKHPERVILKAIERMLPGGPLSRKQMGNLRVYGGAEHPHAAQNPDVVDLSVLNPKNTRSA
jgi:large subunit ribosomal protein L13